MKKLIALLLALVMVAAFAVGCDTKKEEPKETNPAPAADAVEVKAMTYAEFMAAATDAEVVIESYVQATQSWWFDSDAGHGKITMYLQDQDGAYFAYEVNCSEEDAAKLVEGTKVRLTGEKAEWAGEIEIMNATVEILEGEPYVAEAMDVTAMLGTEELIEAMNKKVSMDGMTFKSLSYKDSEWDPDIYVTFEKDGATYEFCVENYLTGPDTEVYKAVAALKEGDIVNLTGFLYWYEGPNTHITSVSSSAYGEFIGTWYADGSSANYRLIIKGNETWELLNPNAEITSSGSLRMNDEDEVLELYDPEGSLAIAVTMEKEGTIHTDILLDSTEQLTTSTFLNKITNNDASAVTPTIDENADNTEAPVEDAPAHEEVKPEEEPALPLD